MLLGKITVSVTLSILPQKLTIVLPQGLTIVLPQQILDRSTTRVNDRSTTTDLSTERDKYFRMLSIIQQTYPTAKVDMHEQIGKNTGCFLCRCNGKNVRLKIYFYLADTPQWSLVTCGKGVPGVHVKSQGLTNV